MSDINREHFNVLSLYEEEYVFKVRADHPFIFTINHLESNCIFFEGRVLRPSDTRVHGNFHPASPPFYWY